MLSILAATVIAFSLNQEVIPSPFMPKSGTLDLGGRTFVDYTIELRRTEHGEGGYDLRETCFNVCEGKKHQRHEDCDLGCDKQCKGKHEFNADPGFCYIDSIQDRWEFWKALSKIGSPLFPAWDGKHLPDFITKAREAMAPVLKDPKQAVHVKIGHWNSTPCSISEKYAKHFSFWVEAKWRLGRLDSAPDGKDIRVMGPAGSYRMGLLTVYRFDPEQAGTKPITICRCKIAFTDGEAGRIDEWKKVDEEKKKREEIPGLKPEEPAGPKDEHGIPLGPDDLPKIKVEPICNGMNEIVIRADNTLPYAVDIRCDPGTICESDDDAVQDMVFISPFIMHLGPFSNQIVSLDQKRGPMVLGDVKEGKGKIACIEMHKREPNRNVKYHLAMRSDSNLSRLCALTKDDFIPANVQPRIWVYTDHASYDEVSKVLFPKPTAGQYMDVCYDVANVGGVHFLSPENVACINPDLLFGKGRVRPEASQWYSGLCERSNADSLSSSVEAHANDLETLLGPTADDRTLLRIATTLGALMASDNLKLARAAAKSLLVVPQERRQAIALNGGLSGIGKMLKSTDEQTCAAAMDAVEQYNFAPAYSTLIGIEAPTATLRRRAEDLCKKLGRS
jgi:hypothetical protein